MRSSSAVAVITVAKDDLEQRLAAGRAYEEMALRLVLDDVVVAMHAGITEVERQHASRPALKDVLY